MSGPELEDWGFGQGWSRRARIGPFLLVGRIDGGTDGYSVRVTSQRIVGGLLEEPSDLLATSRPSIVGAKRRVTAFLLGCRIAPAGHVCHP